MKTSLLDDSLFGDALVHLRRFEPTAAKAANPANPPMTEGSYPICEGLRKVAKPDGARPQDSQEFAAIRSPDVETATGLKAGNSQDSQDSQGCSGLCPTAEGADIAAVAWTASDIKTFVARRDRLLRWGWSGEQAEALAERLVIRDREQDDRVSCSECRQGRAARCADVAPLPADVLHRCPKFQP